MDTTELAAKLNGITNRRKNKKLDSHGADELHKFWLKNFNNLHQKNVEQFKTTNKGLNNHCKRRVTVEVLFLILITYLFTVFITLSGKSQM